MRGVESEEILSKGVIIYEMMTNCYESWIDNQCEPESNNFGGGIFSMNKLKNELKKYK
jgi:hypothetical protein